MQSSGDSPGVTVGNAPEYLIQHIDIIRAYWAVGCDSAVRPQSMFDDPPDRGDGFMYRLERESEALKLVAHLKLGEKEYVRRRAAEMLGNITTIHDPDERTQVVDALVGAVRDDEDDSVRAAAIDALYQRGEEPFDRLIAELSGDEAASTAVLTAWLSAARPEFRLVAATALGRRGATEAVPELVSALTDPDPRVRARAARACGRTDDPRVVEPLSERLRDDRELVTEAAANALGRIGTERALEALVPLVRADEASLRLIAVDELGQFGSVKPIVVLIRALDDPSETVQRTAMLSLLELLTAAPDGEAEAARRTVLEQLRRVDVDATVPSLVDIAADGRRDRYRHTALWLLSRVAGERYRERVLDCLVDTLDDDDELAAKLAANGLMHNQCPELEKRLRVYLNRERGSPASRRRAQAVLDEMCDGDAGELVTNGVNYTYVDSPADYTDHNG